MIYKLKHVPTGLYYQPHKHRGSNLSKRGKIYQTATHGLSSSFKERDRYKERTGIDKEFEFTVYCAEDGVVHRMTKDLLKWETYKYAYGQVRAETNVNDWIIEEVK